METLPLRKKKRRRDAPHFPNFTRLPYELREAIWKLYWPEHAQTQVLFFEVTHCRAEGHHELLVCAAASMAEITRTPRTLLAVHH
ncbi:hypothetical protein Micbo1qcDRAFT_169129, partial [Microdochium bolleyi]